MERTRARIWDAGRSASARADKHRADFNRRIARSTLCHEAACVRIAPAIISKDVRAGHQRCGPKAFHNRWYSCRRVGGERLRRRIIAYHTIGLPLGQTPDDFGDLVKLARRLRGPRGCPWDRAQTFPSLLPHLVEETWEVFCASKSRRRAHLRDELGDVLYTVVFLTLLAEEAGWFTLPQVLQQTRRKMIRRHPHVFKTRRAHTAEEAYAAWQRSKRNERRRSASPPPKFRDELIATWERMRRETTGRPSARSTPGSTR